MATTTRAHEMVLAVSDGMPIFEAAVPCEIFGGDRSHLVAPSVPVLDGRHRARAVVLTGFVLAPTLGGVDPARIDTLVVPACQNVHENPPAELWSSSS